jgi:uracil-DNA glycosylase family 4
VPTLAEVEREALACTRCPLSGGRTQVVFGTGDPGADLMFVGEGPGAEEDRQGLPFVGRSGQLLDRLLLEELGITRDRVYIANVVKCLMYTAMVQLGDGSWERIGRLVRRRYGGEVMSVDAAGRLVPKRVTGWHASPLAGRRVFRLRYGSARAAGAGRVGIELTGDHPVLTRRGWVAVQDLVPGDEIATGQGLSPVGRDVVCGTLLGDGHLSAASSHLSFGHSARQGDYAVFKAGVLAELAPRVTRLAVSARSGGDKAHPVVHVRTLASRALRTLAADFYDGRRKRVPPWLADGLNARMLAFWFMDDGHMRLRPPRQPSAEIATCGFDDADLAVLVDGLALLGLPAKVRNGRLHFDVVTTRQLSKLMAPYVPPPMRHKLHPEVAAEVAFDPDQLAAEPPEVMFDAVDAVDVTDAARTDTMFFCIDVDETHNFVTAGGVVHNCRPPANRDPQPEEIDACRPWLERQLDIVDPRVVVTLGNFATKLLLDTTEGITRLRGRTFPFRGGVLVPTFHPAAVLRGGAQPMAQMRSDLARAKLALALARAKAPAPA